MKVVAEMKFSEFVELIPLEFNKPRQKKYKQFQERVGSVLQRYRDARMQRSNDKALRNEKWQMWLSKIDFDVSGEIVAKVDDAVAADLMRGKGDATYFNAIYYRLHSLLDDLSWVDEIDILVFGSPLRHRGTSVFMKSSEPLAPFSHLPILTEDSIEDRLSRNAQDGVWLSPYNHFSIPLVGRTIELEKLDTFLRDEATFKICPVIGPSGAGKTRLVSEWLRVVSSSSDFASWDIGLLSAQTRNSRDPAPWLDPNLDAAGRWELQSNTLVVIDYTFSYAEVFEAIAHRARRQSKYKIRLVVLDHIMPEFLQRDLFWKKPFPDQVVIDAKVTSELFHPIRLTGQNWEIRNLSLIAAHASTNNKSSPPSDMLVSKMEQALSQWVGATRRGEMVLQPLVAVLIGRMVGLGLDIGSIQRRDLFAYYFDKVQRLPWKVWRNQMGWAVGALVSAATLCRQLDLRQIKEALPGNVDEIFQYAKRIVSKDSSSSLAPFEPDILGEEFFLCYLKEFSHKRKPMKLLANLLEIEVKSRGANAVATDLQETLTRLTRNLSHDDFEERRVIENWEALLAFLNSKVLRSNQVVNFLLNATTPWLLRELRSFAKASELAEDQKYVGTIQETCAKLIVCYSPNELLQGVTQEASDLAVRAAFEFAELTCKTPNELPKFRLDEFVEVFRWDKKRRWNAFHLSCHWGLTELVALFLKSGENPNSSISDEFTALMVASCTGQSDTVRTLLKAGADPNALDRTRYTALMGAARGGFSDTVKVLLPLVHNVDHSDRHDWSALGSAVEGGHCETAKMLIEAGANIDREYSYPWNILMMMVFRGETERVKMVLELGANPNFVGDRGYTPLMEASSRGHLEIVLLLLDRGADPKAQTDTGFTAKYFAETEGHDEIVKLLPD